MNSLEISGTIIPLVTPFTDDLSMVSEVRLARIVRSLIPLKPAAFLVCGDMGEFAFLSLSERKLVLEIVLRETSNAVPVLTNVTTVGTMAALDLAQHAKRHGARGAVVMPPYYGQFTAEEMQHHFKVIANYSDQLLLVVDPQKRLDAEVAASLQHNAAVHFPVPVGGEKAVSESSTSDEFAVSGCVASPVALLEYEDFVNGPGSRALKVAASMRENGKVRFAKALLQYRELEAGPPRNPYQMSSIDIVRDFEKSLS